MKSLLHLKLVHSSADCLFPRVRVWSHAALPVSCKNPPRAVSFRASSQALGFRTLPFSHLLSSWLNLIPVSSERLNRGRTTTGVIKPGKGNSHRGMGPFPYLFTLGKIASSRYIPILFTNHLRSSHQGHFGLSDETLSTRADGTGKRTNIRPYLKRRSEPQRKWGKRESQRGLRVSSKRHLLEIGSFREIRRSGCPSSMPTR